MRHGHRLLCAAHALSDGCHGCWGLQQQAFLHVGQLGGQRRLRCRLRCLPPANPDRHSGYRALLPSTIAICLIQHGKRQRFPLWPPTYPPSLTPLHQGGGVLHWGHVLVADKQGFLHALTWPSHCRTQQAHGSCCMLHTLQALIMMPSADGPAVGIQAAAKRCFKCSKPVRPPRSA